MIILDTNVISEPMKLKPNDAVLTWLDKQDANTLFITTISLAELLTGIENLPKGKRKNGLSEMLNDLISKLFASRILSFDQNAAIEFSSIMAKAKNKGHSISMADAQIAAIAAHNGFSIATRDIMPFHSAGLNVIDPWEGGNKEGL